MRNRLATALAAPSLALLLALCAACATPPPAPPTDPVLQPLGQGLWLLPGRFPRERQPDGNGLVLEVVGSPAVTRAIDERFPGYRSDLQAMLADPQTTAEVREMVRIDLALYDRAPALRPTRHVDGAPQTLSLAGRELTIASARPAEDPRGAAPRRRRAGPLRQPLHGIVVNGLGGRAAAL